MPLGAALATLPTWPADELLVALVFPLAWALLGGGRRRTGLGVGAALILLVAVWALGTVTVASYATPPTVDDWLRYHLLAAGLLVAVATALTTRGAWRRPRTIAGLAVWLAGAGLLLSVPFVDGDPTPPRDALFPLPAGVALVEERENGRRLTLVATDGADQVALVRRLGEHLRDTKDWQVTFYPFTPIPDIECRPAGRLANPYRLCAWFTVEPGRSTVELRLDYTNPHDPIF